MPTMVLATYRAAYPGDGPFLVGWLAVQNRSDRPASRVAEDEAVVGSVGFRRPNLENVMTSDLAKFGLRHQPNSVILKQIPQGGPILYDPDHRLIPACLLWE